MLLLVCGSLSKSWRLHIPGTDGNSLDRTMLVAVDFSASLDLKLQE